MGVACGSVQLPGDSQAFVKSVLGRLITRPDLEKFLRLPPASNRGIADLRSDCIKVLLAEAKPHLTDLPLPYHELGPTMKLVLDMWLPHLPLERDVASTCSIPLAVESPCTIHAPTTVLPLEAVFR